MDLVAAVFCKMLLAIIPGSILIYICDLKHTQLYLRLKKNLPIKWNASVFALSWSNFYK